MNFSGKNTRVGSISFIQRIFPTHGWNPGLLHCRQILYHLNHNWISENFSKTTLQLDWETMETVTDFIFLDSKITVDGDCSHEIKRCLFLARKAMTNLQNILKSGDIVLPTKVRIVKAMVFPVVMYGCESWTQKKAECWRIDALNCHVGENSLESFGQQGHQTSQS